MVDTAPGSRKAAVAQWRRRSAVVAFWRKALPASILAILIAMSGWIIARGLMPQPKAGPAEVAAIQMLNWRFFGRDDNDRAFLMAARRAIRDARQEGKISLDSPTFNLGAGKVRANKGVYVEGSTDLILRGDVVIVDGKGGTVRTQEALIDTKTGVVTDRSAPGSGGIQIESSMGKIAADDYTIAKNGAVTFKGRVTGTIQPKR